ncbi:hypothetical protein ACVW0I_005797 [Bradyrhizobium sp. LM6.11]
MATQTSPVVLPTDQTPSSAAEAPEAVPRISAATKAHRIPILTSMTILSPRYSQSWGYPKSLKIELAGSGERSGRVNDSLTIKNYEKSCG